MTFYAHGGYAQEIYADVVHGNIDGVELLQFGVYRGIGLEDWYHMLNAGFRVPAMGACDYPACRMLGDCGTYVWSESETSRHGRLAARYGSRSEFLHQRTTAVVGGGRETPRVPSRQVWCGAARRDGSPARPLRSGSRDAPAIDRQWSRAASDGSTPQRRAGRSGWSWSKPSNSMQSAWIAARAYSLSPLGTPDAESHTNPVYVCVDGRAPYDQSSLDRLVAAIDQQIAIHKERHVRRASESDRLLRAGARHPDEDPHRGRACQALTSRRKKSLTETPSHGEDKPL